MNNLKLFSQRIFLPLLLGIFVFTFFVSALSLTGDQYGGYGDYSGSHSELIYSKHTQVDDVWTGDVRRNIPTNKLVNSVPDPQAVYCNSAFATIFGDDDGFVWDPETGQYIQVGMACWLTSLMNSNLQSIKDANPGLSGMSLDAVATIFADVFDICVENKNNDNDPSNDIDLEDGVGLIIRPGETMSPEAQSIMDCKQIALQFIKDLTENGGEYTPLPFIQMPPGLIIPGAETYRGLYGINPTTGELYPTTSNWCEELAETIAEGGHGVVGVGGGNGMGHSLTIIGIDCDSTPPKMTLMDPNGGIVEAEFSIGPNGEVSFPNGIPDSPYGPGTTADYIAEVDVELPPTPTPTPTPTPGSGN